MCSTRRPPQCSPGSSVTDGGTAFAVFCAVAWCAANLYDGLYQTTIGYAVVDITLKGVSGLELIKDLQAQGNQTPVLVLSMHEETLYAERALQAGARGYVSKNQPSAEVMNAIRKVLTSEDYLSQKVTAGLLKRMADSKTSSGKVGMQALTDRELEIFQLVGRGQNVAAISQTMNLSPSTVETSRARIRGKLGVRNAATLYSAAATWVRDRGA